MYASNKNLGVEEEDKVKYEELVFTVCIFRN